MPEQTIKRMIVYIGADSILLYGEAFSPRKQMKGW